jgi:hypothetical protein
VLRDRQDAPRGQVLCDAALAAGAQLLVLCDPRFATEPGQQRGARKAELLADPSSGNVPELCDLEQVRVWNAQQDRGLLEGEHLWGVFMQRGSTHDQAIVSCQVRAHRVLNEPAFAPPAATRDVAESLRLIGRQPDEKRNVVS